MFSHLDARYDIFESNIICWLIYIFCVMPNHSRTNKLPISIFFIKQKHIGEIMQEKNTARRLETLLLTCSTPGEGRACRKSWEVMSVVGISCKQVRHYCWLWPLPSSSRFIPQVKFIDSNWKNLAILPAASGWGLIFASTTTMTLSVFFEAIVDGTNAKNKQIWSKHYLPANKYLGKQYEILCSEWNNKSKSTI